VAVGVTDTADELLGHDGVTYESWPFELFAQTYVIGVGTGAARPALPVRPTKNMEAQKRPRRSIGLIPTTLRRMR
jgi:hypothetical protein